MKSVSKYAWKKSIKMNLRTKLILDIHLNKVWTAIKIEPDLTSIFLLFLQKFILDFIFDKTYYILKYSFSEFPPSDLQETMLELTWIFDIWNISGFLDHLGADLGSFLNFCHFLALNDQTFSLRNEKNNKNKQYMSGPTTDWVWWWMNVTLYSDATWPQPDVGCGGAEIWMK